MASRSSAVGSRNVPLTLVLRVLVIAYLLFLVVLPTSTVVKNTVANSFHGLTTALQDPDVIHALWLTLEVSVLAVLINLVFGVGVSLLLVRRDFPGKRLLSVLIDVPLSVSPVVVGLALVLVYNPRFGWFGPSLESSGISIIFALPGIVMATCFVSLPLVIREVVPVLEELGDDQEQAARSLGAGPWATFRRITLPSIRWAVVYGVVLSLARSIGEFGAVKIVAGNVNGATQTGSLVVQQKYQSFATQDQAYAVSFILVLAAVLCLIVVALLRPQHGAVSSRATVKEESP